MNHKALTHEPFGHSGRAVLAGVLNYAFYALFVVMFLVFTFATKAFFSTNNLVQLVTDCSQYFILCGGLTFVLLTGNLDLSVGAVVMAAGHASIILSNRNAPLLIVIVVPLLIGALVGWINGILITKLKMQTFIVTMGMMILVKGINLTLTNGIYYYPSDYLANAMTFKIGGLVPVMIIVTLGLLVVFQFIKKYTKFGRNLIAVGCNKLNAAKMGINVDRNLVITFVISGVCAAFAGIISVTNVLTVTPATGDGFEFTATAMVLLGGTSLRKRLLCAGLHLWSAVPADDPERPVHHGRKSVLYADHPGPVYIPGHVFRLY